MIETTTRARPWHPLADVFPLMPEPEIEALAADIRTNGRRLPIITLEGAIPDGRNRWLACERAGIAPRVVEFTGDDPLGFVVSVNLQRRQLSASQRAMAAAAIANMRQGARSDLAQSCAKSEPAAESPDLRPAGATSKPAAAAMFGVSRRPVQDAAKVRAHAPELIAEVNAGRLTAPQAVATVNRAERRASQAALPAVLPSDDLRLDVADAGAPPLADESVDLIVTSPPYGLGKDYGTDQADDADVWPERMRAWLAEMYRVARPGGRLALDVPLDTAKDRRFRATYPTAIELAESVGWRYRTAIIWVELGAARLPFNLAHAPHIIAPVEVIAWLSRGDWVQTRAGQPHDLTDDEWRAWNGGIWTIPGESRPWGDHPAAYPVELAYRLVKLLSYPGDLVLDPFVGSGTTAVAASRLGRRCVGFDLSAETIASARRRLGAERGREAS